MAYINLFDHSTVRPPFDCLIAYINLSTVRSPRESSTYKANTTQCLLDRVYTKLVGVEVVGVWEVEVEEVRKSTSTSASSRCPRPPHTSFLFSPSFSLRSPDPEITSFILYINIISNI